MKNLLFLLLISITASVAQVADPAYIDYGSWLPRGVELAPQFTLPDNRKVACNIKRRSINPADAVGRGGVKYFRNQDSPNDNRLLWLESKDIFGQAGSPGGEYPGLTRSADEWRQKARQFPLVGLEIDEFLEGEWRVPTESEQYRAFKSERKQMYAEQGRTPDSFICYGAFGMPVARDWKQDGVYKGPTDPFFKNRYASQSAARGTFGNGYFDLGINQYAYPNVKFYPETPYTASDFYKRVYEMEMCMLAQGSGGKAAYVSSNLIESLPSTVARDGGDTHIGITQARRVASPGGIVVTSPHPDWDLDQQKAMYFVCGLVVGTHAIFWDDLSEFSDNPNYIYPQVSGSSISSSWFPDVPGTAAPYEPNGGLGYPPLRLTAYDMLYAAAHLYKACDRTGGASWNYLRYKVGNGAWIETQPDKSDILFHAAAGRGDCMGRVSGQAVDFFYYNPMRAKNQTETITVEIGGRTYTKTVRGGILAVFNENL